MTKGLMHSPFATTELFYISPGRIHRVRTKTLPSAPPRRALYRNVYMNL